MRDVWVIDRRLDRPHAESGCRTLIPHLMSVKDRPKNGKMEKYPENLEIYEEKIYPDPHP